MKIGQILNTRIMMVLLLLPFLEPLGVEEMSIYLGGGWTIIHRFFSILKLVSFVIMTILTIYQLKKPTIIFFFMLIFQVWTILRTIMNGGFSFSRLITSLTSIGISLVLDYYIRNGNVKRIISVIEIILMIIIIINLITIMVYPNGMYVNDRMWRQNWLLGYRNLHIQYYLPYIFICAINQYLKEEKLGLKFYMMLSIVIISVYFSKSTTSLISVGLIGILVVLFGSSKVVKKINLTSIYIVSVVLSILIIFMGIQNYFAEFLRDVLGKDVTLSSRTQIWAKGIKYFSQHPILGNGIVSVNYSTAYRTYSVNQMHNMYFDILVVGGIVLLAIYTVIIVLVSKQVRTCSNVILKNVALFVFSGYAILFITEARRDLAMFNMFMLLAYYLPTIVKQYNIDKCKTKKYRLVLRGKVK